MSQPYPPGYGYAYPTGPAPAAPRRSRWPACLAGMGCGCLGVVVALAAAGAAGYYAFETGALTMTDVALALGQGPAYVEVDNFRDEAVYVTIQELDVPDDGESVPYSYALTLNAFDVSTLRAPAAGRYQVDFSLDDTGDSLGTCTLALASGDEFQFVALPDGIVVNNVNHPSDQGTDFDLETSALCQ